MVYDLYTRVFQDLKDYNNVNYLLYADLDIILRKNYDFHSESLVKFVSRSFYLLLIFLYLFICSILDDTFRTIMSEALVSTSW